MEKFNMAVIPGDGIGKEVMPEAIKILELIKTKFNLAFGYKEFDWGCHHYEKKGYWMPPNWKEQLTDYDVIFFGATGWPKIVPDHQSLWDSLIKFRREFDQYINMRPVKFIPGISCPLKNIQDGDIDYIVVRENTEGEYSSIGGRIFENTDREIVIQESIFSKKGVDRVIDFAFNIAKTRKRKKITSATKSNGISITMPYWDERFKEISKAYPDISTDQFHIDGLTIKLVLEPQLFDVIVASNLFGDIISDLGPATAGTIGIAPSANLNPEKKFPSLFEPVHGSAPDIYGKNIANPIGQIWSAAMMFDFLGHRKIYDLILKSITTSILEGPKTPDMGGKAKTKDVGHSIFEIIKNS